MFYSRKSILSLGAAVLAAGALTLTAPRAAHAVAAALVQVTNTAANPAIAQTTDKQAAQVVNLGITLAPVSGGSPTWTQFSQITSSGSFNAGYTVPANQTLIITSVDITPTWISAPTQCTGATPWDYITLSLDGGTYFRKAWTVSGLGTFHYSYPQGILMAAGSNPVIGNAYNSACPVQVEMTGYLTAN
jgi:hypothetical protein